MSGAAVGVGPHAGSPISDALALHIDRLCEMGLQALAASLKRRRALFRADVQTHGYASPTTDELVYWTYVYSNSGEFNGQLKKYKGKRKLADWITKSEYPNAIKLLESYRMVKAMKIF